MKPVAISKSNYYFSRKDMKIISICLKYGYKVYPNFLTGQKWVRFNALIILSASYRGREETLMGRPFDQRYLSYYSMKYYRKFYDEVIMNNLTIEKAPPPPMAPPPPSENIQTLFAPPPPPNEKS